MNLEPQPTLIVTVRERFSLSKACLDAIYEATPPGFKLIFVAGAAPKKVSLWLGQEAARRGFELIERPYFLTPNEARNIGLARASSRYVVFIENDVIPSPGWLGALVDCARQTGAEVIAPLICEGVPMHKTVHQAGGTFAEDPELFFAAPAGTRRIKESHILQGQPIGVVKSDAAPIQTGEFHCVMIVRSLLTKLGGFDEGMLSTREHLDFAMEVYRRGGKTVLAPQSIVTFLIPWAGKSLELTDIPFHLVRWSPAWAKTSIDHFKAKWGIAVGQRQDSFVSWRYGADIVKPCVRKLPLVGRFELVGSAVSRLIVPLLRIGGDLAASRALAVRQRTQGIHIAGKRVTALKTASRI